MLVYATDKQGFLSDVQSGGIEEVILEDVKRHLGYSVSDSEVRSWRNSLMFMSNIVNVPEIPEDSGIAIEYKIPVTNNRIDFILSGRNEDNQDSIVIIELKQWENVSPTDKDGVVRTYVGQAERELTHPSYQAWTYAALLEDYSEVIQTQNVSLSPCAYLHNCASDTVINAPFYSQHTSKAPSFLKNDAKALADFIKQHVKHGDTNKIMYQIDNGKIRPSKALADCLLSLLEGNQEFLLIDDQKVIFETALKLATTSTPKNKNVLIIEGGPGTGKSVVAINLLVALTKQRMLTQYVTKNAAPREVYAAKLKGSYRKSHIDNLFKGSGTYTNTTSNEFDALLVDEAHRLNAKSGMFQNLGENQIKEIINSAKFSMFFIDENQKVTFKDIGEKRAIEEWASKAGANTHSLKLASQFRCNGSDGYISWLDNTLQIHPTANNTLKDINYDFRVFDTPNELSGAIFAKNEQVNKSRLVAGYCWDWISKKDSNKLDITIEEHNFAMKWNLASDGNLWIMKPSSVSEVGCIHTCQGLELDCVGVIIGSDFIIRDGQVVTDATKRAKTDSSIKGFKKLLNENKKLALTKADEIIKNTYRTLMSRGAKGCYLFCTDKETNDYFKECIGRDIQEYKEASIKQPVTFKYKNNEDTTDTETFEPSSNKDIHNKIVLLTSKLRDDLTSFDEAAQLHLAAKAIFETLLVNQPEHLTMNWNKSEEKLSKVGLIVEETLGEHLPRSYTLFEFKKKCDITLEFLKQFQAEYD